MPVTDITQLQKLHKKYSALFAYIKLLNAEIVRRSARLEELRKKEEQQKEESVSNRLDGLNAQWVIIYDYEGERK